MHQRDATTEHFGKAPCEILFNQVTPVGGNEKKKKKKKYLNCKRCRERIEDNQKNEENIFTRDYKLDLFSPVD